MDTVAGRAGVGTGTGGRRGEGEGFLEELELLLVSLLSYAGGGR